MVYSWNNFFAGLFMEEFGGTLGDANCNVASAAELGFHVFHQFDGLPSISIGLHFDVE